MIASVAKGNDETEVVKASQMDFLILVIAIFSVPLCVWFIKSGRSSVSRRGELDPAVSPNLAVLLMLSMFLLGGLGAWWGKGRFGTPSIDQSAWMYAASLIAQLPIIYIYITLHRRSQLRHAMSTICTTCVVFVPTTLAVAGVGHMIFSFLGWESLTELGHTTLDELAEHPWGVQSMVIVICVTLGAGIVEEVMYRGLVLPLIASLFPSRHVWGAMVATSIAFVAMHVGVVQPSALMGLFVLSLGLCWARIRSGGVLAPIAIHIIFNAMNIAIVYSTKL